MDNYIGPAGEQSASTSELSPSVLTSKNYRMEGCQVCGGMTSITFGGPEGGKWFTKVCLQCGKYGPMRKSLAEASADKLR